MAKQSDDDVWLKYLATHEAAIVQWVGEFAPHRKELFEVQLGQQPRDRARIEKTLNQAWFECPDTMAIRTPGFFKMCDLIDGGYEVE